VGGWRGWGSVQGDSGNEKPASKPIQIKLKGKGCETTLPDSLTLTGTFVQFEGVLCAVATRLGGCRRHDVCVESWTLTMLTFGRVLRDPCRQAKGLCAHNSKNHNIK
jgi:hypothetical protein